jgi:hypothetical protein
MPSTKSLPSKLLGAVASAISPSSDSDEDAVNLDGTRGDMPPPSSKSTGKGKSGGTTRR